MNRFLNNTAILALSAALALPQGGFAQQTETPAADAEVSAETEEALLKKKLEEEAAAAAAEAERLAAEQAEAEAAAEAERLAAEQAEAEAAAEAERAATEQAEAAEEAERLAAEQAEAEAAAEAERVAAEQAEAEAERLAAEQAQAAEAERAAAQQAEAEAAAQAEQAEAEATLGSESSAAVETTVTAEPEQPVAEGTETTAVTEQPATEPTEEAAETQQPAAQTTEATAETEQPAVETTVTATETAPAEETTQEVQPVDETLQAARAEEQQAEAAASAAVNADAEAAQVETEAVTEETSRASDEEFAAPTAQAAAKRDGLSKFEKALLIGLGAVVVGTVLKNGDKVVSNSGDRVVVEGDDGLRVLKNDNELMRRPGADVRTETFNDGSTRTIVTRPNGNRVVTIAAPDGRVIQRLLFRPDGSEVVLIDDTERFEPVDLAFLPEPAPIRPRVNIDDELALRVALQRQAQVDVGRNFSLAQIRGLRSVRELAPAIELDALTFASGSAAIDPSQAEELVALGRAISGVIDTTPEAVFLIEGHTDAVGGDAYNLALSDRRAETVALALTEYFDVPPENLITQGYGEAVLKVQTQAAERANRRAVVRNITSLLR